MSNMLEKNMNKLSNDMRGRVQLINVGPIINFRSGTEVILLIFTIRTLIYELLYMLI